jgi:hypothetical protein
MKKWQQIERDSTAKAHQAEVADLNNQIKRYKETVSDLESQLGVTEALKASGQVTSSFKYDRTAKGHESAAVAVLSDWHVEEKVDPKTVNDLNEFNLGIAEKRIEKATKAILRLTEIERGGRDIPILILAILGDLMTGYIHEELREENELSPTQTILWLKTRLSKLINTIRKEGNFDHILIPCSIGNHGRCHDPETELLTRDGWKKYDELYVGEMVATFNVETGMNEWQPLLEVYIDNYDGEIIHVQNKSCDFMVTPRHRMVAYDKDKKKNVIIEMQNFTRGMCPHKIFPRCANGTSEDLLSVTDDEIRLVAWIWTDGHIDKNHQKAHISQSKPENIEHIKNLLDRLNLKYGISTRLRPPPIIKGVQCKTALPESSFGIYKEHSERVLNLLPSKDKLPDWMFDLSKRQVAIFIDEVIRANGNTKGSYSSVYGKKNALDDMQRLFTVNGISCRLRQDNRGDYVLGIRSTGNINLQASSFDKMVIRKQYSGIIWCGTVKNGTLITRRNGMTLVSGNTTLKPRHSTAYKNSYEWLLYKLLEQEITDGVTWLVGESYHTYLEIYGKSIRLHHGDGLKYQGGVGGLTIPTEKAISSWNKGRHADLDIFGHWHTSQQNPKWVSNGSLVGANSYSISIKAPYEPPQQTYFLFDAKRGRTGTWPIFLED